MARDMQGAMPRATEMPWVVLASMKSIARRVSKVSYVLKGETSELSRCQNTTRGEQVA